jgi:hypothetical protein
MTLPHGFRPIMSRRRLLATSMALPLAVARPAFPSSVKRTTIAIVERDALVSPLTLGMARVILRPGASIWAATPGGARIIVVESGVLAIASLPQEDRPLTASEFAVMAPEATPADELLVPAGTTMTFGAVGVASVRNPGARPVVALDVAVYHEEARPLSRAFTTDSGVSFQLLANANATTAPLGKTAVVLEKVSLGAKTPMPDDLGRGLMLARVDAGVVLMRTTAGEAYVARAAAAAPYAMPGSLQPVLGGQEQAVTAGGVIYLPVGTEVVTANAVQRTADVLVLTVRAVD